jgi:hypothetical protein
MFWRQIPRKQREVFNNFLLFFREMNRPRQSQIPINAFQKKKGEKINLPNGVE